MICFICFILFGFEVFILMPVSEHTVLHPGLITKSVRRRFFCFQFQVNAEMYMEF